MKVTQHRGPGWWQSPARYWPIAGLLVVVASVLRFWHNDRPGFDVDESLYARIAANLAEHGFLGAKPEYIGHAEPYTSHPPFLFWVEAGWFKLMGASIVHARQLTALAGVITVILVAVWLRGRLGQWALLAATFMALDGWLIFTNRVAWAENVQIPLGIAALWIFTWLVKQPSFWRLVLGGFMLGGITVYKYVGACFLLAGLLYLVIQRCPWRRFIPIGIGIVSTVVIYVLGMWIWVGNQFIADNVHQFQRMTGMVKSRGAVQSSGDVLGPLLNQYSIYLVTVAMLGFVGALIGWRSLQCLLKRSFEPVRRADPLLFAWAAGTYAIFGVGRLKLPHYLILIIVPALCYLVAELKQWIERHERSRWRQAVVTGITLLMIAGGLIATYGRIVARHDNAVRDTIAWMTQNARPTDKVIADEFIGNQIVQPYCKITHAAECETQGGRPDYIVAYTTTTQKLPESQALTRLLTYGTVVAEYTGFKEDIKIYKIVIQPAR